jgi:putative endonuclease
MYTVYVLHSKSFNKIYIGFTSDIEQRLIAHNHSKNKGWTRKSQPWILVYSEEVDSKILAMAREKQLKSHQGRDFAWGKVREYLIKPGA